MSNPFKEFVEEMARLGVPEDDTEESRARREVAASEWGMPISELDEYDIIACADDEFLCSEALALWAMIRKARVLTSASVLQEHDAFNAHENEISGRQNQVTGCPRCSFIREH